MNLVFRPLLIASVLLGSAAAFADPPDITGRLSYMEGTVSFRAPGQQQWTAASINYPITAGASLWTEVNARAEVEVGPAEIRIDQSTELDAVQIDDTHTQFNVPQGAVNIHLRDNLTTPVAIETPRGEIDLAQAGSYHVDTGAGDPASPSPVEVTVLQGGAQFQGHNIEAGQSATIATDGAISVSQGGMTPLDEWAASRDQVEPATLSAQYISPDVTGYQDLDNYGQWETDPSYGPVWYPSDIASDWAPYSYGHWVFVAPWGWTWVDDAPWGFAPFHYGRWMRFHDRWGWWPGERTGYPVYAPALVAFIGIGGPSVGWVPLAPYEPFHPYYRASSRYLDNINVATVRRGDMAHLNDPKWNNVSHFANRGAATVVHSNAFTHAQPVHQERVSISAAQLGKAKVGGGISHLQPAAVAHSGTANVPAPHRGNAAFAPRPAPGNPRHTAAASAVENNRVAAPHPATTPSRNFTAEPRQETHSFVPQPHPVSRATETHNEAPLTVTVPETPLHGRSVEAAPDKLRNIPRLPESETRGPAETPGAAARPYAVRRSIAPHVARPASAAKPAKESNSDDRDRNSR